MAKMFHISLSSRVTANGSTSVDWECQ